MISTTILCGISISLFWILFSSISEAASWNPREALEMFLMDNYPWEDMEVTDVKVIGNVGSEPPDMILVEKGPLGKAVFSFIHDDTQKTYVRADVKAFARVVKCRRPFRRRHVIREDDIYVSRMDIRRMPKSAIKDPARILGKSLKRSITANMPLTEDMIEMSQMVSRGKRVVILLNSDGLNIRVAGKTKEKAYVGTHVRAINLSSQKEVSGVLIDENTVEVEL